MGTTVERSDILSYTSPLLLSQPATAWCTRKFKEGYNNTRLTRADVPFKNLSKKWVCITGSNNGIGREAALFFAQCGANLILACRNPPPHEVHPEAVVAECRSLAKDKGHEDSTIEWWDIDMAKLSTVNAFADRWLATGRALDILCNNAGMGTNPGGVNANLKTQDGLEFVHQVNFASHALLTMRLMPALAQAKEPRIVCTTSNTTYRGNFDFKNWDGSDCFGMTLYANNKLYYQIWLTELDRRLQRSEKYKHITINGVHPGYVNTGIWTFNTGDGLFGYFIGFVQIIIKFRAWWWAITPEQGSYAITNAATSPECGPNPDTQGVGVQGGRGGGRYFNRIWETENMPHCHDADASSRVWRKIKEELKLERCDSVPKELLS